MADRRAERRGDLVSRCIEVLRSGASAAIVGPAGIGKTTLIAEVAGHCESAGLATRWAATSLSAQRVGLGAFAGMLRRETTTVAGAIADLRALKGTVLIVDDADLLDDDGAVVLHTIAREQAVLFSVRTGRVDGADAVIRLAHENGTEFFALQPLDLAEAIALVEEQLGGTIDRRSVGELLHASEGNPLLLRELVTSGTEAKTLTRLQGVWVLSGLVAGISVQEVFRNRVAGWPPAVRQVAVAVSVAEAVPRAVLVRCFGDAAVDEAVRLDAIGVGGAGNEARVRHALLRDTLLADVELVERSALLRRLVEESSSADEADAVNVARKGHWLLALGDQERLDVDLVLRAAHQALDSFHANLAQSLARLAFRHEPSERTIAMLARLGLYTPGAEEHVAKSLRVDALNGRFEAFVMGFGPLDNLVEQLQLVQALATDDDDRLLCEVLSRSTEWVTGQQVGLAVEDLTRLAAVDPTSRSCVIASLFAATACVQSGRLRQGLEIAREARVGTNPFHQAQVALTSAEAAMRLGSVADADSFVAQLEPFDDDDLAAQLFASVIAAQRQLQRGQARDAVRTLGAIATHVPGDPVGIGSWARAWLAAALAWSGEESAEPAPVVVPVHACYVEGEQRLARAVQLAEIGRYFDARAEALELVDAASESGYHPIAMWAAHLALRLQPSRGVAELVGREAGRIDGDVAAAVADQSLALVEDHAPSIEKAAARLEELDYLCLAHETYVLASRAYRRASQRAAASRSATAAERLVAAGCVPTFVTRSSPVTVDELTLREREVARAIADGATHREAAATLGISARTAETHLHRAYRKLGVSNAQELRTALDLR